MKRPRSALKKLRILISAGPTQEPLDPVRSLTSGSSGRMGFALAKRAAECGARVILVSGPASLPTPRGVRRIDVVTAREMKAALLKHASSADIIFMTAAVLDWRPRHTSTEKLKRSRNGQWWQLSLVENPDILRALGRHKRPQQILVGFALETTNLLQRARKKLEQKNCDWIVANDITALGASLAKAVLLSQDGRRYHLPKLAKDQLASKILSLVSHR